MDFLALLFPREKKFYRMLEEQVTLVSEAIDDFEHLVTHYSRLTGVKRKRYAREISNKEKQDDVLYTRMVQSLKSTFITPMDREDIHRLVVTFDTIIDSVELVTLKIAAYDIRTMDRYLLQQTRLLRDIYTSIEKIILSLRREAEVERICLKVRTLEQEADIVYMDALKHLFSDSMKPAAIIKLQDLYASMEQMIDQLNEAALIIESLSVKYS